MKQLPVYILGIAPYEGMCTAMQRAAEDFPSVRLDVFTGDLEEGVAVVREHGGESYDCIISRGGTAERIRQITDIPVVEITLSVYDVLRTIKLAENYSQRYAIVGFPSITEPAHTLCDLLRYEIDIITTHNATEIRPTLIQLQQQGYRMVIGDMVTHTIAQELGLNAFLITSGPESLHSAIHQSITMSAGYRRLRQENLFLNSILHRESESIVVLDRHGKVHYSTPSEPSELLLIDMQGKLGEIPPKSSLQFYHNQQGQLYRVTAQILRMGAEKYYLFHYHASQIPLRSGKNGVRSFTKSECEHLLNSSFFKISGALGELHKTITSIAATHQPVMITGEVGTGKEQIARMLYLQSSANNRPFVVIDCSLVTDKGWDFLLNHYKSPLNDSGNTILFQKLEELSSEHGEALLSLILSTDLVNRERLLFSCTTAVGKGLPQLAQKMLHQLGCLPLSLPPLRTRRDEIPSLASLYLGSLNLELGKHISGFDDNAMEQLRQFSWPYNYTQFKRVLQELATLTFSYYIRSTTTAEVLTREREEVIAQDTNDGTRKTLNQIIMQAIQQALTENNGNQTAAAKQLGIGRTTLWRYLNQQIN